MKTNHPSTDSFFNLLDEEGQMFDISLAGEDGCMSLEVVSISLFLSLSLFKRIIRLT